MPLIFQHKLSAYSTTSVQDSGRESYSVHLFLVICIRIYNFFLVTRRVTLSIYAFLSHIESSLTITNKGLSVFVSTTFIQFVLVIPSRQVDFVGVRGQKLSFGCVFVCVGCGPRGGLHACKRE
jgi:hypothetical protein